MSGQQEIREEEGRPEGGQEKHWHCAEAELQEDTRDGAGLKPAETGGATRALEPSVSPPSLANPD
jgi:hypothetical protein